jgi:hypothetical protein
MNQNEKRLIFKNLFKKTENFTKIFLYTLNFKEEKKKK